MGSRPLLAAALCLCLLAALAAAAPLPQEASSPAPESRAFGQPFDEVVVGTTLQVRPRSNSGRQGRRLEPASSTEGSGVAIGEARARRSTRSRRQAPGPPPPPPPPVPPAFFPSSSASQAGAQSFRFPGGLSSDVSYSAAYSAGPRGFRVSASFSYTAPDGTRRRFVYG